MKTYARDDIDWTVTVVCWLCEALVHTDDALPMACQGSASLCERCADDHATDCRCQEW